VCLCAEDISEDEILPYEVAACYRSLALLKEYSEKNNILPQTERFPRTIAEAASLLATKLVLHKHFVLFARDWEQRKTDKEGDKKAEALLGKLCSVVHERFTMGVATVRPQLPTAEMHAAFPGVIMHGHVACCDFQTEPSASQETIDWDIAPNLFVTEEGEDLMNFGGALQYWNHKHKDVYVFYQILKTLRS
jgi:hypothetical protein